MQNATRHSKKTTKARKALGLVARRSLLALALAGMVLAAVYDVSAEDPAPPPPPAAPAPGNHEAHTKLGQDWDESEGNKHSPKGGSYSEGAALSVIKGTGACNGKHTGAEALHTKFEAEGEMPIDQPNATASAFGCKPRWEGIRKMIGTNSHIETVTQTDKIDYKHEIIMPGGPDSGDEWLFNTFGTCAACPDEGYADYYLRCKSLIRCKFTYKLIEELSDPTDPLSPKLKDTASCKYDIKLVDHNGMPLTLNKELTFTAPCNGPECHWSPTKENKSDSFFSRRISQEPVKRFAYGHYKAHVKGERKTSGLVTPLALKTGAGESTTGDLTDEAITYISHLWMVPHCNGTSAYPGDDNTNSWRHVSGEETLGLSKSDYARMIVARTRNKGATDEENCVTSTPNSTAESNTEGAVPVVVSDSITLGNPQLPTGYTEGATVITAFGDGSYITTSNYQTPCKGSTRRYLLCIKKYDECGRLISSCCKGKSITVGEPGDVCPDGTVIPAGGTRCETIINEGECPEELEVPDPCPPCE